MEGAVRVGYGEASDFDWLVSVDRHAPNDWIRRSIGLGEYLVARSGGRAVGVLRHSLFWGVIPFMDFVFVEPELRKRRIGSMLLNAWENQARSRHATMLMTSSMDDEPEPQAWHKHKGFIPVGSLDLRPHQRTPEVFFVKPL